MPLLLLLEPDQHLPEDHVSDIFLKCSFHCGDVSLSLLCDWDCSNGPGWLCLADVLDAAAEPTNVK